MDRDFLSVLDRRISRFEERLAREVGISPPDAARSLATAVHTELEELGDDFLDSIKDSSPLSPGMRLSLFHEYKLWRTEIEPSVQCPASDLPPENVKRSFGTVVILLPHLYFGFVFPGDSVFEVLSDHTRLGSAAHRCSTFLRSSERRAFRNAIAHGNWNLDWEAQNLKYFARIHKSSSDFAEFTVSIADVRFWLELSQLCTWIPLLMTGADDPTVFYEEPPVK